MHLRQDFLVSEGCLVGMMQERKLIGEEGCLMRGVSHVAIDKEAEKQNSRCEIT